MSSIVQPAVSGRLAIASTGLLIAVSLWLLLRMTWLVLGGPSVASAPVPPIPSMAQNTQTSGEFR